MKKPVLYGEEAIENRLSLDFYRPLEKGVIKGSDGNGEFTKEEVEMNLNAARDLVKAAADQADTETAEEA